jgi:hypothetical protein
VRFYYSFFLNKKAANGGIQESAITKAAESATVFVNADD